MKKFAFRTITTIILAYVMILAVMFVGQRSMMYFPQAKPSAEELANYAPTANIIQVVTQDKLVLEALEIPPQNVKAPVILAFHGNGSAAIWMASQLYGLTKDGTGLISAEYRGYSGNDGTINEQGLYADADAYYAYVRQKYPHNPLVIYGQSLGSGVAVDLASRVDGASALILEVPFDSVAAVVAKVYPFVPFPSVMVRDKYASLDKIGRVSIPKLFLIAGKDEVVGEASGLRLYAAADENKTLFRAAHAAHMTIFATGAEDEIRKFLHDKIGKTQ